MSNIIFVDTETTGLDPDRHEVWEIALIEEGGTEHEWRMKPERLRDADPGALRINHYYERIEAASRSITGNTTTFFSLEGRGKIAWEVARLTSGKHLVGAVPSFDANFLEQFLVREGYRPAWHYHLVCCENLAAGRLGIAPPWDSRELSAGLGLDKIDFGQKHTAIADARWAKAMYEAALDRDAILPPANTSTTL